MAVSIRFYADIQWVPDGAGGAVLGQAQANWPGLGPVGNAQTLRLQQLEQVFGGDTPTQGQIQAALAQGGTDLGAQVTTAVTATINGWASGQQ